MTCWYVCSCFRVLLSCSLLCIFQAVLFVTSWAILVFVRPILRSAFTFPCTGVSTRSLLTLSVPLGLRPLPRPLICAVVFSTALLHSTSGLVGIGSEDICICVCNIVIDIYMFTSRFALCAPRVLLLCVCVITNKLI